MSIRIRLPTSAAIVSACRLQISVCLAQSDFYPIRASDLTARLWWAPWSGLLLRWALGLKHPLLLELLHAETQVHQMGLQNPICTCRLCLCHAGGLVTCSRQRCKLQALCAGCLASHRLSACAGAAGGPEAGNLQERHLLPGRCVSRDHHRRAPHLARPAQLQVSFCWGLCPTAVPWLAESGWS